MSHLFGLNKNSFSEAIFEIILSKIQKDIGTIKSSGNRADQNETVV